MGYTYRANKAKALALELEDYSRELRDAGRRLAKISPCDSEGNPLARTRGAKLRATARAEAAALVRAQSEATARQHDEFEEPEWMQYADNPECWGGQFGLWLAAQEATTWRK